MSIIVSNSLQFRKLNKPVRVEALSLSKVTYTWGSRLALFRLPFKGASILFGWAQIIPFPKEIKSHIGNQHIVIKAISSTFNLPIFFINQAGLYRSVKNLANSINCKDPSRPWHVISEVKTVFFSALGSALSAIKLPQMFYKAGPKSLGKISRQLAIKLTKAEVLLALSLSAGKFLESAWSLMKQIERDRVSRSTNRISVRTKKSMIHLGVKSFNLISISTAVSSVFFGIYVPPLLQLSLSSSAFAISIITKMRNNADLIWKGRNIHWFSSTSFLPP